MNTSRMSQYKETLLTAAGESPTFGSICNTRIEKFKKLRNPINFIFNPHYNALNKGKAIPMTEEQLDMYLVCYADMHICKLNESFHELFKDIELEGKLVEVIDWGCGQGLASCTFVDYIRYNSLECWYKLIYPH